MNHISPDIGGRRPLVIWGASGHAKVVADVARLSGWTVAGFLDDTQRSATGIPFYGATVLGGLDEWLATNAGRGDLSIALGVGDNAARIGAVTRITRAGMSLVSVIHPAAIVSVSAQLGAGCAIMAGAVVQADVRLGAGVIVNTRAGIDHDCDIAVGCHLSVNATLAGKAILEKGVTVGPGAVICAGRRVGEFAVIGAGAVVVRDIPANVVAVGVPARAIRSVVTPP